MKITAALAAFILIISCRMVNDGGGSSVETPALRAPSPFCRVDSLIQDGRQNQALSLLRTLPVDESLRNDVLWRVVGIYHGRGMLNECISAIDSLQARGWGDLTGWKISVYELNRERDAALGLVAVNDILLAAWLNRNRLDSFQPTGPVPVPAHLGQRAARLLLAPTGITPAQIQLAAADAAALPATVGPRVVSELERTAGTTEAWWPEALKTLSPELDTPSAERLQAQHMRKTGAGDHSFWRGLLGSGGEDVAAYMIAIKWPETVDWRVIDILVENGMASNASAIASARGDENFAAGVQMALHRNASRFTALLELCGQHAASPSVELRARAALFRARALRALRRNDDAFRAYHHFARDYPLHPTAGEAGYIAGRYFDGEQNWGEAADAYMAGLRSADGWVADDRGHWRAGFCLYMNGRGAIGDSVWAAAIRDWPYSHWRDEMLFWRARYANRQGNHHLERQLLEQVAMEHPWEYYGMLAAQRLGTPHRIDLSSPSPVLSLDPVLSQALELFASGYGSAAVEMLQSGRLGDRGINAVALALLGEYNRSITAMRTLDVHMRESHSGMLPDSLIGWYFPAPYREHARSVTDTMTVSSSTVQGIMRQESYFNRFVVSSAGASGLIQLMPATASDVARWNGLPRLSSEEFFDPWKSILYGSLYINSQVRRYTYPSLYLAAYNAGPGNATRWVNMHGFDPADPELYIEQITFRETRIYAKTVERSAWIYERIRQ